MREQPKLSGCFWQNTGSSFQNNSKSQQVKLMNVNKLFLSETEDYAALNSGFHDEDAEC